MKRTRKEGTKLKLFSVRLNPKQIDRLKMRAVREHTSVQALVAEAIDFLLKERRGEGCN
jgi:hypothetical protein